MAMEIFTGAVTKTRTGLYSGAGIDPLPRVYVRGSNRIPCQLNYGEPKLFTRSLRRRVVGEISAFDDKRHMEYYNCCTEEKKEEKKKKKKEKAGWNSVSEKKRAKLVKELAKNLNSLSELGFGLETDEDKLATISEAARVLQGHLEHLREEGKKKLEKKAAMAGFEAERITTFMDEDDSSSSSSESSGSECEDEGAAYISMLRNKAAAEQLVVETMRSECLETMATAATSVAEVKAIEEVSRPMKRVEVCMGGKCKKAGAPALMEEFQNGLGAGASVVGCKCMGKCKMSTPNVRVFNGAEEFDEDDSVRSPRNPLFLGVGLDEVSLILANYFGSEQRQAGVGATPDSSAS